MEKEKTISGFEDLVVWQQAIDLAAAVHTAFVRCREFALKVQVMRAAVSISSNIAEGYERGSNKEFVHFLYYAKGSCGEVRSQIQLAVRLGVLAPAAAEKMLAEAKALSAKLGAYNKVRATRFQ